MLFTFSRNGSLAAAVVLISTLTTLTHAQIPSFLTKQIARNSGNLELEVFYGNNQLSDGERLAPGLTPSKFALCDSCGISTGSRFTIVLLDVDANAGESPQFVHAIQSDFRIVQATELESQTPPALPYIPATVARINGRAKRYVWLLYNQPPLTGAAFVLRGVPNANSRGQFNVAEFERANGFEADGPEWAVHFTLENGAVVIPSESISLGIPTRTEITQPTTTVVVPPPPPPPTTTTIPPANTFSLTVTRTQIEETTTTTTTRSTTRAIGGTTTTAPTGTTGTTSRQTQSIPTTIRTTTTTTTTAAPGGNATETTAAANTTSIEGGDSSAIGLSTGSTLLWSTVFTVAAAFFFL